MNRVKLYANLIGRLRQALSADQVERVAAEIRELAMFPPYELREAGVGSSGPSAFSEALPQPPRRKVFARRRLPPVLAAIKLRNLGNLPGRLPASVAEPMARSEPPPRWQVNLPTLQGAQLLRPAVAGYGKALCGGIWSKDRPRKRL
jgi:hypothetical protein